MEQVNEDLIKDLICVQKKTYAEISSYLQERYPGEKGFSRRSVQRYCSARSISARVRQEDINSMVADAVQEVSRAVNFLDCHIDVAFLLLLKVFIVIFSFSVICFCNSKGWSNLWSEDDERVYSPESLGKYKPEKNCQCT